MKRILIVLSVTACVLTACGEVSKRAEGRTEPVPVRVMEVSPAENSHTKSYVGTVEAGKSAYLRSKYPGKLLSINVRKGDKVTAGQVIAEIESSNVISSHEMAHSTLRQAEDGWERSVKLHEKGSISDVKMVEVETQLAKARAAADAADKALEDCKIKAPYDGVIDDIFVDEGLEIDMVTNLMHIVDASSVEIRFPVPENEVTGVDVGRSAAVSVPALGLEDAAAKVISKGVVASPLSHTYECALEIEGKVAGLMPGMVAKVYLDDESSFGLTVPASVVRTDALGRYVWCVEGDKVVKNYVVTGRFSGKGVIITSGLEEGSRIITEGVQKVSTGMKVRVIE